MFMQGCAAIPILGPVVNLYIVWKNGEAQMYYESDSLTLYESTVRMLQNDGIEFESEDKGDGNYYILAKATDDIKITINKIEDRVTVVKIRINVMGDKPYAELLYKKLSEEINVIEYDEVKMKKRRLK